MVAFFIFSLMLMLYLPAYQTEIMRLKELKVVTNQWQLMADLIELSHHQAIAIDQRMEAYTLLNEEGVSWQVSQGDYQIVFDGGNHYEIQLLNYQ